MKHYFITIKTHGDDHVTALDMARRIIDNQQEAASGSGFSQDSKYGELSIKITDGDDLITRREAADAYFDSNLSAIYSRIASGSLTLFRGDLVSKAECERMTKDD